MCSFLWLLGADEEAELKDPNPFTFQLHFEHLINFKNGKRLSWPNEFISTPVTIWRIEPRLHVFTAAITLHAETLNYCPYREENTNIIW